MNKNKRIIIVLSLLSMLIIVVCNTIYSTKYLSENEIESLLEERYKKECTISSLTSVLSDVRGDVKNVTQYGTSYILVNDSEMPSTSVKESFNFWVTKNHKLYTTKFVSDYESILDKELLDNVKVLWEDSDVITTLDVQNTIVYKEDSYTDFIETYNIPTHIIINISYDKFDDNNEIAYILSLQEYLDNKIKNWDYDVTLIYTKPDDTNSSNHNQIVVHMDKDSDREMIAYSIESSSDDEIIQ